MHILLQTNISKLFDNDINYVIIVCMQCMHNVSSSIFLQIFQIFRELLLYQLCIY